MLDLKDIIKISQIFNGLQAYGYYFYAPVSTEGKAWMNFKVIFHSTFPVKGP